MIRKITPLNYSSIISWLCTVLTDTAYHQRACDETRVTEERPEYKEGYTLPSTIYTLT
jgi:hypothetical protein